MGGKDRLVGRGGLCNDEIDRERVRERARDIYTTQYIVLISYRGEVSKLKLK